MLSYEVELYTSIVNSNPNSMITNIKKAMKYFKSPNTPISIDTKKLNPSKILK
jgi:hypothetical protein